MIWITHLSTTAANAAEVHIFVVDGKAVQSLNTYQVRDKVIDPPAFFAPEVPMEAGVRIVVDPAAVNGHRNDQAAGVQGLQGIVHSGL